MNATNEKYDALIRSYLDGQSTADEALELLSWVAESEENRIAFKSQKDQDEVWKLTDFVMPDGIDVEEALSQVNAKIDAMEEETPVVEMPWLRRNYKMVSGIAAALVVAMFLGFLVSKPFNQTVTLVSNDWNTETPYVLPDGSAVTFEGESRLSHPKHFGLSERSVDFEGTAFFNVVKDENHPFVVHCNGMDVQVLGTSFLLNADEEKSFVDLYSGKVRMTTLDAKGRELAQVELNPGERGVWNAEGELKMMTYPEVKKEQLEQERVLVFDDACLSTIVESLEYIFEVHIKLDDNCASKKITARFTDEDSIEEVLETIAVVSNVTVTKSGNVYTIR
ncbi:MAG: FecR domain-containing protein [Bacteroidales bacterium]|nr:FecR domain-containing protein [Bacteroidales bacterium]